MKFNKRLMVGVVAVAAAGVLSAGQVVAADNTLTWPSRASYKDWDPAATYSEETYVLGNVYETLTFYVDGAVMPRLATSWEKSDGGKTWTFQLREGVKFHDGAEMNAETVKKSVEWTKTEGRGAAFLWGGLVSTETPSSHTIVFNFSSPIALDLVASGQYGSYIISPGAVDKGHDWMQEGQGYGTGPYKFVKVEPGVQVVLEKFDDYWGGWEAGQIDRVIIPTVAEGATRIQMIKSGEADIAAVPSDQVKTVDGFDSVSVTQGTSWRNSMFLFNFQKYPTDNPKFREALTYLWDYNSVLNDILYGIGTAPVGPLPKSMWGHGKYDLATFDPAHAMKLLEESGVPKADWKVSAMYIGSVGTYANSIELFQATAGEAGVEVELLPGDWGTIWGKAKKLDTAANIQSMTWWPAYATPQDWLYAQYRTEKKALFNLSFYANPDFDAALDAAIAAEGVDVKASAAKYIEAQDILMKEHPAIFFADVDRYYAHSDALTGMEKQFNPAYETLFVYDLRK
jgi:peptide/nickel transport system substrate-binding protein